MSRITATEASMRQDRRRVRAETLSYHIDHALRDFIPDHCRHAAMEVLYKLLYDTGAEVITDHIRAEAGLPPRGPDGWTHEELVALERHRLEIMMKPIFIPSALG